MSRKFQILALLIVFFGALNQTIAQRVTLRVDFSAVNSQTGFDVLKYKEWAGRYKEFYLADSSSYTVPFISTLLGVQDSVQVSWKSLSLKQRGRVEWVVNGLVYPLVGSGLTSDLAFFALPKLEESYSLEAQLDGVTIGKIFVSVYPRLQERVIIVPLVAIDLNKDSIENFLNGVYQQAQLTLKVSIRPKFIYEKFNTKLLDNPSDQFDQYTDQMTAIRDAYFEAYPEENRSAYYIFITPGFVQKGLQGYMVRNKAVGFVKKSEPYQLNLNLARQLGFGIGVLNNSWMDKGPAMGSTDNLMDVNGGTVLTHHQWVSIQQRAGIKSYYDDYEDVKTNSGIIAFYLWEENAKGDLVLSGGRFHDAIKRPFKRNQLSYHLDITNIFFMPIFTIQNYRINALHFIIVLLLIVIAIIYGRRFIRWTWMKGLNSRFLRWMMRFVIFGILLLLCYESFLLVNRSYAIYQVRFGELEEFNGFSIEEVQNSVSNNRENPKLAEDELGSQVLVKKNGTWHLERRKNVLYFNSYGDGRYTKYRYASDSDSLKISVLNYAELAESHYMVISYFDSLGKLTDQKVFNHFGTDITDKLKLDDPSKRILVFVNGYRPTSLGNTFEENFNDLTEHGLEFPNSNNLIYESDRYEYWRPWKEIDLRFEERINPSETFYADGHFSVETSNHRSLVNFTSLSGIYPERCNDPNQHTCKTSATGGLFQREENTVNLFNLSPNLDGFNIRRANGRIAGRNLYQMFNELPNKSKNDTLFIVAHSMGYAYALGIIEQLRGKIEFGGFYIIAPENASAGLIRMMEWQEVWQYGNDFDKFKYKAPCLLDGIAPQTKVGGLSVKRRAYFPVSFYDKQGFFSSHFIGHYTWIFDLEEKSRGYIKQR